MEKVKNRDCFLELGEINDETLTGLYATSKAIVLVSKYEGFGLPVIEGFAYGKPALVSDCSSLPEIGGRAVIAVNPEEPEDIVGGIKYMMNKNGYKQLCKEAKQRGVYFANYNMLEKTLEVYRRILCC